MERKRYTTTGRSSTLGGRAGGLWFPLRQHVLCLARDEKTIYLIEVSIVCE